MSIVSNLLNAFEGYPFKLSEAYEACPTVNKESVRSRIYENLGTVFSKIGRGVYLARESDCIVIEGNGVENRNANCAFGKGFGFAAPDGGGSFMNIILHNRLLITV